MIGVIITFSDNSDFHIVAPNQVNQYWHDIGAKTTENKNEIIVPINQFVKLKNNKLFQSKMTKAIRMRSFNFDFLTCLVYSIRPFDNTLNVT